MKYENYTQGYGAFEIDLNDPVETAKVASIDDVIARARARARHERDNQKLNDILSASSPYHSQHYAKSAEEYDQLADWLEELKAYRANEGMSENVYKMGYKFGYNKAIDEYTEYLEKVCRSSFAPSVWRNNFRNDDNEVTDLENMDVRR